MKGGSGSLHGRKINMLINFALGLMAILILLCCSLASCESNKDHTVINERGSEAHEENAEGGQAENAKELGTLRVFVNRLEGELNEPVEAQIRGEVTRLAEGDQELWVLVKVSEFNVMGEKQGSLTAAPGSELCIRLRKREGEEAPSVGDRIEVNAMVSKSLEGPVIIGRMYKILGNS